ncbi:SusC/RagA family TonB-linked outer membrane protein [Reichenbachiella sp. 5M10]|nr:SusC/RagA family TonB-linked outer membrane protein [Reichenbachiella sp. 5M10]
MKMSLMLMLLLSFGAHAQDVVVKGTVTSEMGETLPGVSVLLQGTSTGTVTDLDGNYSLKVSSGEQVLVYSFIGMQKQEISVGGRTVIDVIMLDDVTALEEVVVVGYGTKKKALVTGANLRQTGEDIEALNTGTAMEALQGITPGVSIARNNGSPGAGTKVTIRGLGTNGNSNPLYVVDGVPVVDINYLNPSDIESIDVLKDAASAAIYGSRGANGVVLVTTRKGQKGAKPQVSYNGYYGVQNIYKKLPALNAQEYMYIMDEGRTNDGLAPTDWEATLQNNAWLENNYPGSGTQLGQDVWSRLQAGWEGTDWVDEITQKDAPIQNHSINITGAGESMIYSVGFSYFDQEGLIGGDLTDAGYKRLTGRLNTEFRLFEVNDRVILKIGENLTYSNTQNRSVATGNIYWNDLHDALVMNPLTPAYWNGSPNEFGFTPTIEGIANDQTNPVATLFYRHNYQYGKGNSIVGNVYAELEPIKKLRIRSSFGLNSWFGNSRSWSPTYALSTLYQNQTDGAQQDMYQGVTFTWTTTATYERDFGAHNVQLMVGTEQIRNDILNANVGGSKANTTFQDPDYAYLDNVNKQDLTGIDTWGKDWAANGGGLLSYMGRLSYNYNEKYLVDFTLRRDGSSNFLGDKKYGTFPSVAAGWNFTEEDFMSGLTFLDQGKLRASWGQNGNQNVDAFLYQTNIIFLDPGYYFGPNKPVSTQTAIPENVPNPDVGWETSEQIDIGLDAYFLNSRLSLTVDWYQKMTKDWLLRAAVQGTAGADAPIINGGDVKNSGVEILIGWQDDIGDFKYGVTMSGATLKNEVTKINNAEGIIQGEPNVLSQGTAYVSRIEEGKPMGFFYGYETDGILQNQQEVNDYKGPTDAPYFADQRPGDVRFVDQNNDGVIDENDKIMLGDPIPDFELGLQLNAEFKGVYANMTLTGKFGQQVMQSYRSFADRFDQNYTTEIFGRWHGEGTSDRLPRLSSSSHRNTNFISDIYMHDADYVRINNLTIGYNFAHMIQNANWINGAKVYVAVNNLYTFTEYSGMDPEVSFSGVGGEDDPTLWASGIDLGLYPLPRTVMLGVNLTF